MEQIFIYVFFIANSTVFMDPNYPPLQQESLSDCVIHAMAADIMFEESLPDNIMWEVGCVNGDDLGANLQSIYDKLVAEVEGERL